MSLFGQLPFCLVLMDYSLVRRTTLLSMVWQILNGIVYHIQSMAAWVLMEYISTVTHRSLSLSLWIFVSSPLLLRQRNDIVLVTMVYFHSTLLSNSLRAVKIDD